MAEGLTCYIHPNVPTNLRCSKCGRPICTRCIVETPVGLRCRQCAQLRRIPTYSVTPLQYATASAVAVGVAVVAGIGWSFIQRIAFVGFFTFFIAIGVGYIMGEVVSLAVNRKRGTGIQVIVGVGVFLSYLISQAPPLSLFLAPSVAAAGMTRALFNPIGLLITGLAIYLAVNRIK